jgi:hypothetical protein
MALSQVAVIGQLAPWTALVMACQHVSGSRLLPERQALHPS